MLTKALGAFLFILQPVKQFATIVFFIAVLLFITFRQTIERTSYYSQNLSYIKVDELTYKAINEFIEQDKKLTDIPPYNYVIAVSSLNKKSTSVITSNVKYFDGSEFHDSFLPNIYYPKPSDESILNDPIFAKISQDKIACLELKDRTLPAKEELGLNLPVEMHYTYICRRDRVYLTLFTSNPSCKECLLKTTSYFNDIYNITKYGNHPSILYKTTLQIYNYSAQILASISEQVEKIVEHVLNTIKSKLNTQQSEEGLEE